MMRIAVSDELEEMRAAVRRFVEAELEPWAGRLEGTHFPPQVVQAMAAQGFLGMRLDEEHGGAAMSLAQYCLVQEELSRSNPVFSVLTSSTGGLTPMAIQRLGTPAQKKRYLPPLVKGEARTAFALTEPEAGSDSAAIKTRAVRKGDGWSISGVKHFISGGEQADCMLVLAVTDPGKRAKGITAFLVDGKAKGLKATRVDTTMGSQAWTLAELSFEDCMVQDDAVLGSLGGGFAVAQDALNEGRLNVASICLGGASRLLELAAAHAKQRSTFGALLAKHQAIQWMLADSATEVAAARSLLYETLRGMEAGREVGSAASMCKLYCSEVAGRVADRAVQIHGGMGVVRGFPVERFYRDLRLFRVGEGTSEVQRMVIARDVLRD
jgi:acyl-CoA dehydrogenase